jgi:hypothetical protein
MFIVWHLKINDEVLYVVDTKKELIGFKDAQILGRWEALDLVAAQEMLDKIQREKNSL